ncbi:sulfite exporter TauE/SafE family protein [Amycolatopsis sp. NPDC051071]|uniref:sulfite exporter TauE/SafE family protein n=1 Tax=Amycolatopsis sp. NPDC051071 TaxID=3154637 RepID=UPI00341F51D5
MLIEIAVLFGFGCLSGVTTVGFGFGGGFITVPVVYAFALADPAHGLGAMHMAVATSTAVMVVNAGSATFAQLRAGRLRRDYLWPLIAFIGLGAVLGSLAATVADESLLRWLFVAYLALTIGDSVVRKGFVSTEPDVLPRALGGVTTTAGGTGIGAVASFLGVGGSVLTVPLLRRKGLPMAEATALANPLSLPVAAIGTAVYAFAAPGTPGAAHLGYIDLVAAGALLCGSLPAIAVTRRVVGRIPDRAHAIAYLALLGAALIAIVVR